MSLISNAEDLSLAPKWQKLNVHYHQFSTRWKNEFIIKLHKRSKWKRAESAVKEGDLVVGKDHLLPQNEWRLGRITKLHQEGNKPKDPCGRHNQNIAHLCVLSAPYDSISTLTLTYRLHLLRQCLLFSPWNRRIGMSAQGCTCTASTAWQPPMRPLISKSRPNAAKLQKSFTYFNFIFLHIYS